MYAETRTREQLDRLLHYRHPIPVRHGFTDDYVAKHYPGWTFNELMAILDGAGIVDRFHMAPADEQLERVVAATGVNRIPQPPVCSRDVVSFDFTDADHWRIHWRNGDTTTRIGPG
ncbi:MAG TPA: hypothetical protein VGK17_09355 [Propionicimonas sp.]|jgi:hypothetical protein